MLTLTSTLEAEPGYVIIELADKGGRRNFLPTGETVTIRSVKLERGEIATPYARLGQQ